MLRVYRQRLALYPIAKTGTIKFLKLSSFRANSLPRILSLAAASLSIWRNMELNNKTWLQIYVDAMTEKDPYKRLAMVRELRRMPRQDESEDFLEMVRDERSTHRSQQEGRKTKTARRR